jgi:hypothetical protein
VSYNKAENAQIISLLFHNSAQGTTFGLLLLLAVALSSLFIPANVDPAHLAVNNINVYV